MTVLVLGGTAEAHELATALHEAGRPAITSLAGRVASPRLPPGDVRVGGFGGPDGLARWLREHGAEAVVDATHPFAARMSFNAASGCARARVPLLRLERPPWEPAPGDRWRSVPDVAAAAEAIAGHGRVFLALGRQELAAFALSRASFVVRAITRPEPPLPERCEVVLARGPFGVEDELALLGEHAIDLLVTRNSGGTMAAAKLDAARQRGIGVVMIERPARPPAVRTVATVAAALKWIRATEPWPVSSA